MRIKQHQLTKSRVVKSMASLPETFTLDEFIDHLILLNKIDLGIAQAKAGKVHTIEEVEKRVRSWSK